MFKKRVRGQITVFIILGIVVLLAVGVIFYLRSEVSILKPGGIFSFKTTAVSTYVDSCLNDVSEKGLILLGDQGGYIEIPENIARDRKAGIWLDSKGVAVIPFWYYKGQQRIPSMDNMEEELEVYVEEGLIDCLDNLEDFQKEYSTEEIRELDVKTKIGRKSVTFEAEYVLKVKSKDESTSSSDIGRSGVEIDVNLKEMHDLATEITSSESVDMYFEKMTIDLMSMNPDIPFTGLEFHCGSLIWTIDSIKDELKYMLTQMVPQIRFRNTDYAPFLEAEEVYERFKEYGIQDFYDENYPERTLPRDAYAYNRLLFNVSRNDYSDLKAMAYYNPSWSMDIYARPSNRGILKSNSMRGPAEYLRFLCINMYHFTYDVMYPLEIIIHDPESLYGTGFNFRFALPVTINHNEGDKTDFGVSVFDIPAIEEAACDELGDREVSVRVTGLVDGISNMEVKGANISYNCIRFICDLGKTGADDGVYKLVTQLPSGCDNGYIEVEKSGYAFKRMQLLDEDSITVPIDKLKTVKVKVEKYLSSAPTFPLELRSTEQAMISVEDNESFADYVVVSRDLEEEPTLDLFEEGGEYFLNIFLMDEDGNDIKGGYIYNWSVSFNDLLGVDEVLFKIYEQEQSPESDEESFEFITQLTENTTIQETYKPVFR